MEIFLLTAEKSLPSVLLEVSFSVASLAIIGCCGSPHFFRLLDLQSDNRQSRLVLAFVKTVNHFRSLVNSGLSPEQVGGSACSRLSWLFVALSRHSDWSLVKALSNPPFSAVMLDLLNDIACSKVLLPRPLDLDAAVRGELSFNPDRVQTLCAVLYSLAVLACMDPENCPVLDVPIADTFADDLAGHCISLLSNRQSRSVEKVQKTLSDIRALNMPSFYVCDVCKKSEKHLSYCSGCEIALYCSPECQNQAWKSSHRLVCKQKLPKNLDEIGQAYLDLAQDLGLSFVSNLIKQPIDLGVLSLILNSSLTFLGMTPRLSMTQTERQEYRVRLAERGGTTALLNFLVKMAKSF